MYIQLGAPESSKLFFNEGLKRKNEKCTRGRADVAYIFYLQYFTKRKTPVECYR